MDWQMFLFSTAGHINRAKYWLAALVYVVLTIVACIVAVLLLTSMSDAAAVILYVGGGVFCLGMFFSIVVVAILGIWGLVELGCLRGTTGPNRFGDDPLSTPALQPVAP